MGLAIIPPYSNFSARNLGTVSLEEAFSVTYNLTLCSVVGEKPDSIVLHQPLAVTLAVKNSYCSLTNIVVTMSGNDITSSSYHDGAVSIPSVTGNVEITAIASYNLPNGYTNIESIGVPLGSRFNTGITPSANTSFIYKYSIDKGIYEDTYYGPHFLSAVNYYAPFARSKYSNTGEGVMTNRCGAEGAIAVEEQAPYVFSFDAYNDGNKVIVNDGEYSLDISPGAESSDELWFACYGAGPTTRKYWLKGRVFGAIEIYESGAPAAIFVPAKDSSNVYGFYDVVRQRFFNSASVAFTA